MTDNMRNFLKSIGQDEASQGRLEKIDAMTGDEAESALISWAAENGIVLTAADFNRPTGQLEDGELDDASGGCFMDRRYKDLFKR